MANEANGDVRLFWVGNQVNALIPSGQIAGTPQLVVTRTDGTQSAGIDVLVTNLEPGIFSVDSTGTGQGSIQIANTGFIAGPTATSPPAQPVQRGQYISIYCTGLGPVSNPPADGSPALGSPLSSTQAITTATIGGIDAPVIFSGLAPTLVGVYVVNAQVPTAVTPGNAVPVTISVGSLTSNSVTIAVQ
jgi:uncharacterized protein (TIGR03437 family)